MKRADRAMAAIERWGNWFPHPVVLFAVGAVVVLVVAEALSAAGVTATRRAAVGGWAGETEVSVRSLLASAERADLLEGVVDRFMRFPAVGVVLVAVMGVGAAERVGLIGAGVRAALGATSERLLIPSVFAAGVLSSVAADAGYVVVPSLAATVFARAGRDPIAGLMTGFAGVGVGVAACPLITPADALLAGLTQSASAAAGQPVVVAVTCNWYFSVASAVMLTLVAWLVTARWTERRPVPAPSLEVAPETPLTPRERAGLWWAGGALVVVAVGLFVWTPDLLARSRSVVPAVFFLGAGPSIVFGIATRYVKGTTDAVALLVRSVADVAPVLVLMFFAAQFVGIVHESRLAEVMGIWSGQWVISFGAPAWVNVAVFVLAVLAADMILPGMSAKYAILAPLAIPFFLISYQIRPEFTQAAYRIGDAVANTLSPMNPYLLVALGELRRRDAGAGVGTLVSLMLPYSAAFFVAWLMLLSLWAACDWRLGPG